MGQSILNPDGSTTNPGLLKEVADWRNDSAWVEFHRKYDPLVRRWCRSFQLDADAYEDIIQRIWLDLARRVIDFRYDPKRTFRGWLRKLVLHRTLDVLRKRSKTRLPSLDDEAIAEQGVLLAGDIEEGEEPDSESERVLLLEVAEEVQAYVRPLVAPVNWQAFWLIAVELHTVREVADIQQREYGTVFAGYGRVIQKLKTEGERRLAVRRKADHQSEGPRETEAGS